MISFKTACILSQISNIRDYTRTVGRGIRVQPAYSCAMTTGKRRDKNKESDRI